MRPERERRTGWFTAQSSMAQSLSPLRTPSFTYQRLRRDQTGCAGPHAMRLVRRRRRARLQSFDGRTDAGVPCWAGAHAGVTIRQARSVPAA
jgi:hypothetical protein